MAMTLKQVYDVAHDAVFLNRCEVAITNAAQAISTEAPGVRVTLAKAYLKDPRTAAAQMAEDIAATMLANNPTWTVTQMQDPANDAAMATAVSAIWNAYT